ncbi:hypothetical protein [Diadegma fenestrale ichnovirus]|nr:hypothetical protein [Diadegma fenestrale ichnovirus]
MLVVVLLTLTVVLAGVYYIARYLADALAAIASMYLNDLGHGGLMRYFSTTHKEDRVE